MKSAQQLAVIPRRHNLGLFGALKHRLRAEHALYYADHVQGWDTEGDWMAIPAWAALVFEYVDGSWPNAAEVNARYPKAIRPTITTGFGLAEIIDCEPGNPSWGNPAAIAQWMYSMRQQGVERPGLYTSASMAPYYIQALAAYGQPRSTWRLGSAHWTDIAHVCSPYVCGYPQADWTQYAGNVGGLFGVDYDLALSECFTVAPPTAPVVRAKMEEIMMLATPDGGITVWYISGNSKVPVKEMADRHTYQNVLQKAGFDEKLQTMTRAQLDLIPTAGVSKPA